MKVIHLLNETEVSTLKAALATVGQHGSHANKLAAEKAKQLPGTVRAAYKEKSVKDSLQHVYKKFDVMLTQLGAILDNSKELLEKDSELKRELDLYVKLMTRTIHSLQARAGAAADKAVKESLSEAAYTAAEFNDDFYSLFDTLKSATGSVAARRSKLRSFMKKHDFINKTQADERFDLFLQRFDEAIKALKACDNHLRSKR